MNLTDEMQRLGERVPISTFLRRWPPKHTKHLTTLILLVFHKLYMPSAKGPRHTDIITVFHNLMKVKRTADL